MLPNMTLKMENVWRTNQEPGYATYIPSALVLLMAIEDGWNVVKIEPVPADGQLGFIYLVTLESRLSKQSQEMVMPKSALIEKILEEFESRNIPAYRR